MASSVDGCVIALSAFFFSRRASRAEFLKGGSDIGVFPANGWASVSSSFFFLRFLCLGLDLSFVSLMDVCGVGGGALGFGSGGALLPAAATNKGG
jgi:hypothetical protein